MNTKYLGKEWFECISSCIDEAEKLGMKAWLYDEDRWPPGAAGGLVPCGSLASYYFYASAVEYVARRRYFMTKPNITEIGMEQIK